MINISFDAKRAFHNNRGLGNYSRYVLRLLSTYYPENNYFLFNTKKAKTDLFAFSNTTREVLPEGFINKSIPALWRFSGCIKQIKQLNTDIYHGMSQELPYGIHKEKLKKVITAHDAIFMRFPELYDSVYRKIFIEKNKYSCKTADKIIAISQQTKDDFVNFFNVSPEKIEVIYQGCNNIFREEQSTERKESIKKKYNLPNDFLLNVGAIEKRKNIESIIRAIHIGNIDIPLVIVGNKTTYLEELIQLVAELKLEKKIIFLHGVPTEDLPAIYASASIFIYPSRFEGFGIPILEALCTGTAVITSREGCFKETGGNAAEYVDYNNTEEIAFKITEILSSEKKRNDMIERGHKHSQRFKDEAIAKEMMLSYKDLLQ